MHAQQLATRKLDTIKIIIDTSLHNKTGAAQINLITLNDQTIIITAKAHKINVSKITLFRLPECAVLYNQGKYP